MFEQPYYMNYSQLEFSQCSINFSSFIEQPDISSLSHRPQKKLTGLKLSESQTHSTCDQLDFNRNINMIINDSVANYNLSSIRKIDVLGEQVELTDLGESSILNFLNDISNKQSKHKHRNPITDMTINPMIEEVDENTDNDNPEACSSNILNSLSQSLKKGVIIRRKEALNVLSQTDDSICCIEFDIKHGRKITMLDYFEDVLEDINKYNNKITQSNFDLFSINDETIDMINVYAKLEKTNKLIKCFMSNTEHVADIESLNTLGLKEFLSILSGFLSSKGKPRFQSIINYTKRRKQCHNLQMSHKFYKHYNTSLNHSLIDALEQPVALPLLQNVNFTVDLLSESDLDIKSGTPEKSKDLALEEIAKEYKYIEINQIVTNNLYLEMLKMFDNLVAAQAICNTNCISYNDKTAIKENEYLMCENTALIFEFLKIAEILNNQELIVKLHGIFYRMLQLSIVKNSFDLFSFLVKAQVSHYHKRITNILPVDRSLTVLNKIENNEWGKYTVSRLCVDEFEKLLALVENKQNGQEKTPSLLIENINEENSSNIEDLNYTKFLNLKINDKQSYTEWLQKYHQSNDIKEAKVKKKHIFNFLRKLRDKWYGVKAETVEDIKDNDEESIKENVNTKQSIFDIFEIDRNEDNNAYQSLYILAHKAST